MRNWRDLDDEQVLDLVEPIMDDLMEASAERDHERHVRHFSDELKRIVHKDCFDKQVREYQADIGMPGKRELIAILRKKNNVRVFWKQWYSKTEDEFLAGIQVADHDGRLLVENVAVS